MAKKPLSQSAQSPKTIAPPANSSSSTAKKAEMRVAEVEHVNGGLLDPLDGKNGLTATLFAPQGSSDIVFFWRLKNYDKPVFLPLAPSDGSNEVDIPSDWVSRCIGQPVEYWYEASVYGVHETSMVGEVFVQSLTEDQTTNSLPIFPQAFIESNTHWLRMNDFQGEDGLVNFNAPPMPVEGMRLYLGVEGDEHLTQSAFRWLEFGRAINAEEALPGHTFKYSIPRGWLARRTDYSSITIKMAWVYSGNPGEFDTSNPADHKDLPKNGEDIKSRHTTLLRVDPGLNLLAPHLRQSTEDQDEWFLNPDNIENQGDVYTSVTTFKGDKVCFYVSGPGFVKKPLGCVEITTNEQLAAVKLPACTVACCFNGQMALSYDIAFGGTVQPSPAKVINVLIPTFQRPLIEQANQDGMLCLGNFPEAATVIAPLGSYGQYASHCWMWIVGKHDDGKPYRLDILVGAIVTQAWKKDGVRADIPRAQLEKIDDCSTFELHVKTSFCEASELKDAHEFPPAMFTISQEPLTPRAPTVKEALNGKLVPWNAREGAHIVAVYDGYLPSHEHTAQWCLEGDRWPLPLQQGAPGPKTFFAPREYVINSFSKNPLITYTVINACKQMVSETLELQVDPPIMQRRPRPVAPNATGSTLDLRTFTDKEVKFIVKSSDADVAFAWWFFMVGHFGVMSLEGTAENGSPITLPIMQRPLENDDMYQLSCGILRSELEKLKRNTPITINFSHFIGPKPVGNVEIKFQSLELNFVKALYDFTDFDPSGKDWNGWEKGKGATDSRDLINKSGPVPGNPNGHYLFDWGYTDTSDPVTQREKLFKVFTDLEDTQRYRFSAWVRDNSNYGNKPRLVIVAGGKDSSPITEPGTAWQLLQVEFTAGSSPIRLSVDNLRMGAGPGNDFDVTGITVEEI